MKRYAILCLCLVPLLAACDHHDEPRREVIVVETIPQGGRDFGTLLHFDHDYAARDISDSRDLDGFTFRLSADSVVVITLTGLGGFDGFLDLYAADFNFIMGDDNGGPGLDPVLVGALEAGDYFVVVGGTDGSIGSYEIDISIEPLGGADLGILDVPSTTLDGATISGAADVDSYIFTVYAGGILDVFVTRTFGDYDGNLQILDEYGNELAWIDPVTDADPSALNVPVIPGTYVVRVGANSGTGAYDFQVTLN